MVNLKEYNQEHLIEHLETLSEEEKLVLTRDIESINFSLIRDIFRKDEMLQKEQTVKPLKAKSLSKEESEICFAQGLDAIQNGQVAVVLMAGGQGTRLGHLGPKGTFDIGLPSGKSLFELQCDKLKSLHKLTNTFIKWYIMTSEDNHELTVEHFEENDYFSYEKESIIFFKQDRLPLVLENGQIALKSPYQINLAANGNGGVFSSLQSNGLLKKMQNDGVQWVYLYGVDNAIARVADPAFIGFTIESGHPIASKSVDKIEAEEKVGVICYRNNHPDIVEYSELEDTLRYARDEEGKLLYRNGNILSHVFSLDFLIDSVNRDIPYHKAHKKVDFYNGNTYHHATEPNGFKFELFIFDMFKYAQDMAVMSVKREEEFSPVKNAEGKDSPQTAKQLILEEHQRWLINAGFDVSQPTEVDTSITYKGEGLNNCQLSKITY